MDRQKEVRSNLTLTLIDLDLVKLVRTLWSPQCTATHGHIHHDDRHRSFMKGSDEYLQSIQIGRYTYSQICRYQGSEL